MKKPSLTIVRAVYFIVLFVGAAVMLLATVTPYQTACLIAGFLLLIGDVAFYYVFYRCPNCGGFLGRNSSEFCQHCGQRLPWE